MRTAGILVFLVGAALAAPARADFASDVSEPLADCGAFVVTGNPQSAQGANWRYDSLDDGVRYVLEGVLFVPAGAGPFAAVIVSHGKGGTPRGYSAGVARTMVGWGMVVIAPMYTHAPDSEDQGNEPQGGDGASEANVLRAHKARDLLSCLGNVDLARVAAHGHSMGAFVTGQLLGIHPADFRAASHTAGGVGTGPNATRPDVAAMITTPYQLHHSDADAVVPLAMDEALAAILETNGVAHRLVTFPYRGYSHAQIAHDPSMLLRVARWYRLHGVLP
ncbi:MAG TPA: dienelactone hydrolase family protein [Vicinamibacteria bacterium]|nr:dienelactone hydrolase family protein [Vicinamibacteria bacterium]